MKKRLGLLFIFALTLVFFGCTDYDVHDAFKEENFNNFELSMVIELDSNDLKDSIKTDMIVDYNNIYSQVRIENAVIDIYILEDWYAENYLVIGFNFNNSGYLWKNEKLDNTDIKKVKLDFNKIFSISLEDFKKNDDGYYVIKEDKINKYIEDIYESLKYLEKLIKYKDMPYYDLYLKFKVEDKKLNILKFGYKFEVDNEVVSIDCEMVLSNYGKAGVVVPYYVQDEIKKRVG